MRLDPLTGEQEALGLHNKQLANASQIQHTKGGYDACNTHYPYKARVHIEDRQHVHCYEPTSQRSCKSQRWRRRQAG